jgi:hypothetical protein
MSTGYNDQLEEYVTIEIDPDIAEGFQYLYEVEKETPFEDKERRNELWNKISKCMNRYEEKRDKGRERGNE